MRVDDVGLEVADEAAELAERAEVAERRDCADEVGDEVGGDAAAVVGEGVDAVEEGAFGAEDGPEGEVDVVPEAGLTFAGEEGVLLRAAEDQAG
ncbi:MAG: hypothetical protein HBSAPP03_07110 [Phycisphaerae bacterium]|nr:MAG: hypothetical protein HBSAPP03_07110 [Phycisphaerae bacterium]